MPENRKKAMEHEGDSDTNSSWGTRNDPQGLGEGAGIVGNRRTSRDYPNYSIVKIGQNTEKSPSDLRRLTVTQTLMKDHYQTLAWKTRKE